MRRAAGLALACLLAAAPAAAVGAAAAAEAPARSKPHRVVIQVSENDPKLMNLALNNAENLTSFYKQAGETVQIEIVAYGPGLAIFRSDTSPVKERLAAISDRIKGVSFSGCGNTLTNQSKQEDKAISLVPEAHVVPTGIARIVQLEEQGWTYIRP